MANPSPFFAPICVICGSPVEIETSKTDSNAEPVHEECYVAKVAARKTTTNENDNHV
jgi:hypothetical protein